jgi:putative nucleotidyltransferase with HDIG domain
LEAKVEGSQPGHGEQVARLAARLAEQLELAPEQVEQIRYAGYLHDIGKVGVPSALLQRSRERFEGEPDAVRLHAHIGESILAPIHFLQPAAQMVKAHHERWDGLGYPNGLRQQHIPLGARLLALANAYVGMTHSAHPPLSPHQALHRLHKAAGSRFDPALVRHVASALQVTSHSVVNFVPSHHRTQEPRRSLRARIAS